MCEPLSYEGALVPVSGCATTVELIALVIKGHQNSLLVHCWECSSMYDLSNMNGYWYSLLVVQVQQHW